MASMTSIARSNSHARAWICPPITHHAEQDVNERSPDILPDGAQLPRMLAQPSCSGSLELGRFLRKGAERPGGKMGAGCLDHLGHLLEEDGKVLGPARQQGDKAQDACPDRDDDDGGEKGHSDDLAGAAMHEGA